MGRKFPAFKEIHYETADELWMALSPTNELRPNSAFIYRGQADAKWHLVPSLLRSTTKPPIDTDAREDASSLVYHELSILSRFAHHCDTIGLAVPNDSQAFRRTVINTQSADRYYKTPSLWPNPDVLDLMAMAQHHGVPTRLLDWSTKAFTAAYFAASSALSRYEEWTTDTKLAVWALDRIGLGLHEEITLHTSPGSISPNLAAQGGLFTVHPHSGGRGGNYIVKNLEDYIADIPDTPLYKLTLPVFQSRRLWYLCSIAGFNGASIYPSADGAGRALIDDLYRSAACEKWGLP